ncbi:MAG: hypothetical protein IPN05_08590 [Sulfuritalea sp.]|jgi:hypothetical protein|nr:hypothetical protein [Sulfuritalea sp.]
MNKIKLNVRQLDGVTLVEQAPEFQLVNGWTQATLPAAAGVLPAGLWGKVPGGDPYLLHVSVLTTGPLGVGDLFELQSGSPSQPRRQYRPTPGNTELVLVRPTDRLRFVVGAQLEVAVELLVESIGGVNELGSRLFAWAQATQASEAHKVTSGVVVAPLQIPAWTGLFHLIHNSANVDLITLPPRGLVPLDATLTLTRRGNGTPVLNAALGDTLSGGLPSFPVTRTVIVMNNGDEWAFVGI